MVLLPQHAAQLVGKAVELIRLARAKHGQLARPFGGLVDGSVPHGPQPLGDGFRQLSQDELARVAVDSQLAEQLGRVDVEAVLPHPLPNAHVARRARQMKKCEVVRHLTKARIDFHGLSAQVDHPRARQVHLIQARAVRGLRGRVEVEVHHEGLIARSQRVLHEVRHRRVRRCYQLPQARFVLSRDIPFARPEPPTAVRRGHTGGAFVRVEEGAQRGRHGCISI